MVLTQPIMNFIFRSVDRFAFKKYNAIAKQNLPARSKTEVLGVIAELDTEKNPLRIDIDGNLVKIGWKIADAQWYEFFKKVNFKYNYTLCIYLDEQKNEARLMEITSKRNVGFGLGMFFSFIHHRGWNYKKFEYSTVAGLTELFPPKLGTAYEYEFSFDSFREPLLKLLIENGWTLRSCKWSVVWGI